MNHRQGGGRQGVRGPRPPRPDPHRVAPVDPCEPTPQCRKKVPPMSIPDYTHLQADEIDYHADLQVQRVERARKLIDPGDVLAIVDGRIAAEADPKAHPLYELV